MNMPEAKLLLDIVNNHKPFRIKGINLDKLINLVKFHNLAPLIFYRLSRFAGKNYSQLPKDIYLDLKSMYLANIHINIKFWNEFLKINGAFRQNNISLLPLKGVDILVRFYPAFDLRSMCDIDILIKEEQFAQAERILLDLGYRKNLYGLKEEYWRKKQLHIAFYKDRVLVELHWGLDIKRADRLILPNLWERVKQVECGNYKINILSAEDAFFSFALHLRHFGNILCLKQALDAARIIKESPQFDWDYVLKESKQGRMIAAIYFILMQANLFCETEIPKDILNVLKIPSLQKTIIKKYLLKHTFQIKSSLKRLYLKAHFLLYDNMFEPIFYLINIPYEQFCKFHNLKPYTHKSNLLYSLRLLYMPMSLFTSHSN